jgi:hypothetical protein
MNNWLQKYTYRINISLWLFRWRRLRRVAAHITCCEFKHIAGSDRKSNEEPANGMRDE